MKTITANTTDRPRAYRHFIEDLGQPATGDVLMTWCHGHHPLSGAELAIGALSMGGFLVVDPHAKCSFQVMQPQAIGVGRVIGQAPDGRIYQVRTGSSGPLLYWDWEGDVSRAAIELPHAWIFDLDVAPDGRVYLPEYKLNRLFRYDPIRNELEDLGSMAEHGEYIHDAKCGADGLVYLTCIDYHRPPGEAHRILVFDPGTSRSHLVPPSGPGFRPPHNFYKDATGKIFASQRKDSITTWHEIEGGQVCEAGLQRPEVALTFSDGGYLKNSRREDVSEVTLGDGLGHEEILPIKRQDSPLRLFSLATGGGKIWLGTIIPLTLWSYDPATRECTSYGNPTGVSGEIYNMIFAEGKLFTAAYPTASLSRILPLRGAATAPSTDEKANPRCLGLMKDKGLALHRPHGRTQGVDGSVYFSALGDYGCLDSGVSRINPRTENVTSWVYPNTTFAALCYIKSLDQLLVSERRLHEESTRFTFISPHDGSIIWSEPVINDNGSVISWLDGENNWVYGLHAYRATLFAFDVHEKKIAAQLAELRVGEHAYNSLVNGNDGEIWGVTNRGVFAASRDLKSAKMLAQLDAERDNGPSYQFGTGFGDDGCLYFMSNTHLMRLCPTRKAP